MQDLETEKDESERRLKRQIEKLVEQQRNMPSNQQENPVDGATPVRSASQIYEDLDQSMNSALSSSNQKNHVNDLDEVQVEEIEQTAF